MRESAVLVGVGVLAGVAIAVAATRALETMLFGVTRLDLPTFIVALLLIASAAALAAAAPIRRAVRVDPRIVLQGE